MARFSFLVFDQFSFDSALCSGVVLDGAFLVTGGYDKDYFSTDIR